MRLTENQRYTISNSLRVAAEHFDKNVETLILAKIDLGLQDQFRRQASDSRALATMMEEAEVYLAYDDVSPLEQEIRDFEKWQKEAR